MSDDVIDCGFPGDGRTEEERKKAYDKSEVDQKLEDGLYVSEREIEDLEGDVFKISSWGEELTIDFLGQTYLIADEEFLYTLIDFIREAEESQYQYHKTWLAARVAEQSDLPDDLFLHLQMLKPDGDKAMSPDIAGQLVRRGLIEEIWAGEYRRTEVGDALVGGERGK